jgi:hypothetical protein
MVFDGRFINGNIPEVVRMIFMIGLFNLIISSFFSLVLKLVAKKSWEEFVIRTFSLGIILNVFIIIGKIAVFFDLVKI